MRDVSNRRPRSVVAALMIAASLAWVMPTPARAGKLSWLDDVVREVVREAESGGKAVARGAGSDGASVALRSTGRLFAHEADEGLEILAKRSDDLARAGRRVETSSEALLQNRFRRLIPHDAESLRTFSSLKPAEKRLVVEMGETAQRLALRYPGQAETMIRSLGTEGLSAVRVFGDEVAEVIVKEGPESVGVLRKTGRNGWAFFIGQVLPHKKKLMAAGVLTAFLADPDKFVDYAGRATEFAVREFGRAGVQIAGAVTAGATRGLDATISAVLARYGLDFTVARYLGMALALVAVVLSAMVVLGLPLRWALRPVMWPVRLLMGRRTARASS